VNKGAQGILTAEQLAAIAKAKVEAENGMRHALALDFLGDEPPGTSSQVSLSLCINKNTRSL
jgi:hypothetical protein